jgi:MFS family permease
MAFGPLVDITGRREFFQVLSLLLLAFAMAMMGMSSSYTEFLAMAILIAAGSNLWHPGAIPYLSVRYKSLPERKFCLLEHPIQLTLMSAAVFSLPPILQVSHASLGQTFFNVRGTT